jgi:hypothetical protein
MKLTRIFIAAVTTPALCATAAPAFADSSDTAQGQAAQATAVVQRATGTAGIAATTAAAAGTDTAANAIITAPGGTVTVSA